MSAASCTLQPRTRSLRRTVVGSVLLILVLCVSSCTTVSSPQALGFDKDSFGPRFVPEPGTLLGAISLQSVSSSKNRLLLTRASPWMISFWIKMTVLNTEGYAAWRSSRLATLSDVLPVRIIFSARLPGGGHENQSGTIFVPVLRSDRIQELTWLIFTKGTELRSDFTPSRGKGGELPIITTAASLGYAVWVPDYSGMGDSRGIHEYCVAESLADSALDGLAAARLWLNTATIAGHQAFSESGRLAIIGYSEGGLAAMGTFKALAEDHISAPGLKLEAVYAMGAPFNLSTGISALWEKGCELSHPEYQIPLVLGWARAYPEEVDLSTIFLPRTIDRILPLFDGNRSDVELNRQIRAIAGGRGGVVTGEDIFRSDYLETLRRDPESIPYIRVQVEARLDSWSPPPDVPLILAATPTDDTVPFANSQNEYDWVRQHASLDDITLVRLASKGHIVAGVEAYLYAIVDFDKREAKLKTTNKICLQK